ncbi:MAG: tetratricopeptide repeat protein, partial [Methanobrevibacter sp.]|nr:tetratricopeptide repeat protein [Methanobrevibacter sp.]
SNTNNTNTNNNNNKNTNNNINNNINNNKNSKNNNKSFRKDINSKYDEALSLFKEKNYSYSKDILFDIINNTNTNNKNNNKNKNYVDAWYLLGAIFNIQKEYNEALKYIKKSLSLDPYHEDAFELLKEINKKIRDE